MSDCKELFSLMREDKANRKKERAARNMEIVHASGLEHQVQANATVVFTVGTDKVLLYPTTGRVQYRQKVWNGGAKKALEVVASISGGASCLK